MPNWTRRAAGCQGGCLPGRYTASSWSNDVKPPTIKLLTKRIARGRHTLIARVTDAGSGVDPLSLAISVEVAS